MRDDVRVTITPTDQHDDRSTTVRRQLDDSTAGSFFHLSVFKMQLLNSHFHQNEVLTFDLEVNDDLGGCLTGCWCVQRLEVFGGCAEVWCHLQQVHRRYYKAGLM